MNKGLMGLRRYQAGGGIGDPDDWLEELLRQIKERWSALDPDWNIDESGEELFGTPVRGIDYHTFVNESAGEAADDLIGLSNLDIEFADEGGLSITPAPSPHAVPPRGAAIERGWNKLEEDLFTYALDQPVHELDEAFKLQSQSQLHFADKEAIEDLIREAGGGLPTFSSEALRAAERKKNSGIRGLFGRFGRRFGSSSIPWGSIAAPLLAAAASPAALAAETAFDFAISPESLGGTASEVPGAGRTWRESPHIDPSDEEVASLMQILLGDSPYSQSQLARPSTTSQRAIDELIRRAQAGTPVNRYRR